MLAAATGSQHAEFHTDHLVLVARPRDRGIENVHNWTNGDLWSALRAVGAATKFSHIPSHLLDHLISKGKTQRVTKNGETIDDFPIEAALGNLFADSLASKGPEAHAIPPEVCKRLAGLRVMAETALVRVAAIISADMAAPADSAAIARARAHPRATLAEEASESMHVLQEVWKSGFRCSA